MQGILTARSSSMKPRIVLAFIVALAGGALCAGDGAVDPAWVKAYENAHTKGRSEVIGINNRRMPGHYRWKDDRLRGPGHAPHISKIEMCNRTGDQAGKCLINRVYEWSGFLVVMVSHVAAPGTVCCDHEIRPPSDDELNNTTGIAYVFDPISGEELDSVEGETGGDAAVYSEGRYLYLVFDGQLARISPSDNPPIFEEVWEPEAFCEAPEMNCWVKGVGDGNVIVEWSAGKDKFEHKSVPLAKVGFKPWPY